MSSLLTRVLLFMLFIFEDLQTTGASCDCSASTCRCGGLSLTTIPQDLPTSITFLYMEYNNITELRMPDFSRYRNLSSLSLPDNHLFVIRSRAFYHLANLTSIDLRWNKLTSLEADTFVGLGGLQALNLDYNNISSIAEGTFSETPRLVHLLLGSNRLTSISPGSFTGLNQLQLLDLFSNQITERAASLGIATSVTLPRKYKRDSSQPCPDLTLKPEVLLQYQGHPPGGPYLTLTFALLRPTSIPNITTIHEGVMDL
ncbi:hypothetical protein Bbelb_080080 [Branchiostoma belcheri]|nr:hypothetical protein Bbelb_080080 [Branchiostoma belcheri]